MGPSRAAVNPISLMLGLLLLFVNTSLAFDLQPRLSELKITKTVKVQCDRKTQKGDRIHVHYKGTLQNGGKQFDSSYDRGKPIAFTLGARQVIQGWDMGLTDMCIGEERKLVVPPHLAYGDHEVGIIPRGSTLIFQTKLVAIDGVDKSSNGQTANESDDNSSQTPTKPSRPTKTKSSKPSQHHHHQKPDRPSKQTSSGEDAAESMTPIKPQPDNPPEENECRLLGPFALFVQGGLGLLAIFSLVWKRWRERPRRPVKIWFFDVSKQVVGSVLLHVLNLVMSMLSSADIQLTHKVKEIGTHMVGQDGHRINPCSFYLINIAIDTTIGIPILIVILRLLHLAFRLTPLARPKESIKSGYYGQPPRATWWLKQCFIYFIGLVLMKLCVLLIVELLPWIAWAGDWALRWTEGNEALQIAFVMFVFPLIMNAMQYYIIDSFIKERGVINYSQPETTDDPPPGASYHTVGDYDSDRDSMDSNERNKYMDVSASEVGAQRNGEPASGKD